MTHRTKAPNKVTRLLKWIPVLLVALFDQVSFAEDLTLDQCIEKAIEYSPALKSAEIDMEISEFDRKSIRGRYLPVFSTDASFQVWDDKQEFSVSMDALDTLMTQLGPMLPEDVQQELAAAQSGGNGVTIRDQLTFGVGLSVAQPLLGLYKIHYGHEALEYTKEASVHDAQSVRKTIAENVIDAYIGMLTAQQISQTANAALKQVDAYEKQVQAFLDNDMIEKNALLKVQVKKADIQKSIFAAQRIERLARARINIMIGRPVNIEFGIVKTMWNDDQVLLSESIDSLRKKSVRNRSEMKALKSRKRAASSAKEVAVGDMLPDLNAVFRYDHREGMGAMQPKDSFFGGLMLSWNFWEWGATWYKLKAAETRERKMDQAVKQLSDAITLDVESKRLALEQAIKDLETAKVQLDQSKENLRVEQVRYDVRETTTTELLDAQTQHLQAENGVTIAEMSASKAEKLLRLAVMGVFNKTGDNP